MNKPTDKLITKEALKDWDACKDGYKRFCELFPKGATLQEASAGLIADGRPDWSNWLWAKCANSNSLDYVKQTHVIAGDYGTATAGDYGTATAGNGGTATAGDYSTATAGFDGMLVFKHWNGKRDIVLSANVGIDGIKPNTPYHVVNGKIVEKESPKDE